MEVSAPALPALLAFLSGCQRTLACMACSKWQLLLLRIVDLPTARRSFFSAFLRSSLFLFESLECVPLRSSLSRQIRGRIQGSPGRRFNQYGTLRNKSERLKGSKGPGVNSDEANSRRASSSRLLKRGALSMKETKPEFRESEPALNVQRIYRSY